MEECQAIIINLSDEARVCIEVITRKWKNRKLIKEDLQRNTRITKKLLHMCNKKLLHLNLCIKIFPIFRLFILTFEQKEPLVHQKFDDKIVLVKTVMLCFITLEMLKDVAFTKLKFLNLRICTNAINMFILELVS